MKAIIIFIVGLIASTTSIKAQSVSGDPFTGSLNVTIPVTSISSGDVSIPIILNHTGSGMKVNDGPGNAGMGWTISTGGAVFREVRGLPDDYVGQASPQVNNKNGWLHGNICRQANDFSPSADLNFGVCSDEAADWAALSNFGYINDTEPDIFSFRAPGLNGTFVFDRLKKTRTIPYQDLKINYTRGADSLINTIEITNNQGVKYTFQSGNKIIRGVTMVTPLNPLSRFASQANYYTSGATYYQSWYLTQITSPAGGSVSLVYTTTYDANSASHYREVNNSTGKIDTLYSTTEALSGKHLESITGRNEKATFQWTGDLVTAVSVKELTYNTTRDYKLTYTYITTNQGSSKDSRPFLTKFNQEVQCNSFPSYRFEYYGINLTTRKTDIPFNKSVKQDLFGYFNGTASSLVPEVYIKSGDAGTDGERYRIAAASNYALIASGGGRGVDSSKVYYGALQRLTLPSGGFNYIKYEPSSYYDATAGANLYGAGIRVKSIKRSANDPASDVIEKFNYNSSGQSTGRWTYQPMFAVSNGTTSIRVPDNLAPEESIVYSRCEISVTGRGKTVYDFNIPGVYPETTNTDFNASLTRLARSSGACVSLGSLKAGYYTYPYAPNTNYDFERGLPGTISSYTRDNKLVTQKTYTYQRTTLAVVPISGVRFESFNGVYQYTKYTLLANVDKYRWTETSKTYDQTNQTKFLTTTKTYSYNSNQFMNQASTVNSDGTTDYITFKYAKDYATSGTDSISQMINGLVAANQHGTLIETTSKTGVNYTDASLFLFGNTFGGSRMLLKQQLTLADPTGFTESTVTGSTFSYSNTKYYRKLNVSAYDAVGNAITSRNQSRQVKSVLMGYNNTLPVADIANARLEQIAYHDFEPQLSTTTAYSGVLTTDSWTGRNAMTMNAGNTVSQTIVKAPGGYYQFSCWAKASGAVTFNIQVNPGSGWQTTTSSYPAASANTWQFIQQRVNVSSISTGSSFSFQVTSNATVVVDNVSFVPEAAEIQMHAYEPGNGLTANLSNRGNAEFQDYDAFGRVHFVRNRNKDVALIKDYHYQSDNPTLPSSHFAGLTKPVMLSSTTYTSDANCVPATGYQWYVDDVLQTGATNSTFSYAFSENRDYIVKLIVSSNNGQSATELKVHPIPTASGLFSFGQNEAPNFTCSDTSTRTLTVNLTGCYTSVSYEWTVSGVVQSNNTNTLTITVGGVNNIPVVCKVSALCRNQTTGVLERIPLITITKTYFALGGQC